MRPGFHIPKVLVVTNRQADMCATKAVLNGFGYDVATATTLAAAAAVSRSVELVAAIVCHHSFEASAREDIASALRTTYPDLRIVFSCPGCTGCDEAAGIPGRFTEEQCMAPLLSVLKPPRIS